MDNAQSIDVLSDYELAELYSWPQTRTLRCNLVLNSDSSIIGDDGSSLSLTNSQDRRLLKIIRAQADVVISGGVSIQREGWFLPPHGRLCVLSRSGQLPWEICPDRTRVFVYHSIEALIHGLRKQETNILCEGGLITAGLLAHRFGFDELALSFSGTTSLPPIPHELAGNDRFDMCVEMKDTEHNMAFGLWRRAA